MGTLDSPWIFWTLIVAGTLVGATVLIILIDLLWRYFSRAEHQILDGGPPPTAMHHTSYKVAVCADEASKAFDGKHSMIRIDFLDTQNRYITSLAIPCFVFKFKDSPPNSSDHDPYAAVAKANKVGWDSWRPMDSTWIAPRSMTEILETWGQFPRAATIHFQLMRRAPLANLAAIRVAHDCFKPDATVTLKYVSVHESSTGRTFRSAELEGVPLRARHPCPPSGFQVYPMTELSGAAQAAHIEARAAEIKARAAKQQGHKDNLIEAAGNAVILQPSPSPDYLVSM